MSNLLGSLFLKKIDSPSLSRPGLPIALQLVFGPSKPFPHPYGNVDGCGLVCTALLLRAPMGATVLSYPGDSILEQSSFKGLTYLPAEFLGRLGGS